MEPQSDRKETILLIEDDEMVRGTTARMLESRGYAVLLGVDGQEGLEVFERERDKIALVLLDWALPQMSGREVLGEMRAIDPDIKVVIFTGYAKDRAEFTPASAVIQKPIQLEEIEHAIRAVLDE